MKDAATRLDNLREQLSKAWHNRDEAFVALAEIEATQTTCDFESPDSQVGNILRRFRMSLNPALQRYYDRLVKAAKQGTLNQGQTRHFGAVPLDNKPTRPPKRTPEDLLHAD